MKHALESRIQRQGSGQQKEQDQERLSYAYLFGVVCPATGDTEALIAPIMNMDVMEKHLALIAQKVPKGRHAVIV
ncbi:IS630 family transposase, partial [Colwellia sp. MB02u-18]|nr:IS630 family transposase [Colwellia sp. MB3u-45]MBA6265822.1 IS630 family transposase [Colwellia sp. MB3u-43]MBA6319585.1 IS630 family transposase [Colwellia sp. MB02u-19]MBA6322976.1 IS630 family transposase [Colwellia sp. MB02u-18]MBA6329589.1 IS630 family transposase [Colwellia sp. MB02u-12]MBA6343101.1 IS630 family transposase [Colwellia sp. MB02u-1]